MAAVEPGTREQSPARRPAFACFLLARFSASLAYQMVSVAVGWQIYALTGDPLHLGLIGLAQFAPMLLLTLAAGHVADRYDRRRIVAVCMAIEALATGVLAWMSLSGQPSQGVVYIAVIIMSAARAFEAPTLPALIPAVVPRAIIARATALATSANQVAQIAGPSLGGVGYGLGAGWVYVFAAGCYLTGLAAIMRMRVDQAPPRKEPTTLRSLLAGFTFIASRRVLLGTLTLDLFAVLLGGATALLPVFARDILHAGPWALGALRAAPACGAVTMAIILGRTGLTGKVGTTLFCALFVFGAATVVFGLSDSILLSVITLTILGAADAVSVVVRASLVQLNTPSEMLGRVSAINTLFVGTSNQLGEFRAGMMAAATGAVPAVVLGGVGTVVIAALWMWRYPELRRLRSLHDAPGCTKHAA